MRLLSPHVSQKVLWIVTSWETSKLRGERTEMGGRVLKPGVKQEKASPERDLCVKT